MSIINLVSFRSGLAAHGNSYLNNPLTTVLLLAAILAFQVVRPFPRYTLRDITRKYMGSRHLLHSTRYYASLLLLQLVLTVKVPSLKIGVLFKLNITNSIGDAIDEAKYLGMFTMKSDVQKGFSNIAEQTQCVVFQLNDTDELEKVVVSGFGHVTSKIASLSALEENHSRWML